MKINKSVVYIFFYLSTVISLQAFDIKIEEVTYQEDKDILSVNITNDGNKTLYNCKVIILENVTYIKKLEVKENLLIDFVHFKKNYFIKVAKYTKKSAMYSKKNDEYSKESKIYSKQNDEYSKKNDEYSKKNDEYSKKSTMYTKKNDEYSKKNDEYKYKFKTEYSKKNNEYKYKFKTEWKKFNNEWEKFNDEWEKFNDEWEKFNDEWEKFNNEWGKFNDEWEKFNDKRGKFNDEWGIYYNEWKKINDKLDKFNSILSSDESSNLKLNIKIETISNKIEIQVTVILLKKKSNFILYFLIIIFFLLIWYLKFYKNPLIVKLQSNPKNLLTLNPKLLEEAEQRLITINQWQTILKSSKVSQKQFDETISFFKSTSKDKAKLMAKRLGAECYQEGEFFRVNMPKSFDLNIDTFLLYFPKEELKKEILDEHDKVLLIANETHQKETYKLATDRTNRLIAPTEQKLTEFLLSSESERVLIDIFAECLLFKDISPYQVNSGVNNESNFFGRVEIIRDIITKENANYLIVGARQLGKSSIIKALERRYEGSSKVDCYSFTMEDENIVLAMSRALGMEGEPTLDKVLSTIAKAPKKSIFLIDEADRFVKHEKEVDYEVTEAFRKLSQEGKATFVLTGFWTLYFAVTSDYHSPLKNFGELIKLEGLDHNACRDLMIEPMKRIGVSYESESIVENVIEFCGRRPNLIAITCNEVLKKLEGKVITQANIDEVVENSSLEDYLKGWGSMSENEEDNRLDRVIIYLTLEKESFRLADIDAWLKEQGKKIDANRIKSSLERLVVGYILEERKKNYSYRVPLFREKLLEDDIEILLDGDLEGLSL